MRLIVLFLSKILCFLAILLALALTTIIFIEYIFPLTAEGNLTYTRISGEPIGQITINIPVSETGENIFKVSVMSAVSPEGKWIVVPGPLGADRYPDYWLLSGPPLKPGESLQVKFVMEHVRDLRYEDYPWTIRADTELLVPVTVYRHYLVTIVTVLEKYRQIIVPVLSALTATLIVAAVISALAKKAPSTTYLPERAHPVFQASSAKEERKCGEWKYVCLKFFIVDECGGKNKPSNEKVGLLNGANYPSEGAFGDLSQSAVKKILELIDSASRIWMQCCIRLIPCVDENGKYIFKAFDPKEAPYEEPVRFILTVPIEKGESKIYLYAETSAYITDLCQFLSGRNLTTEKGDRAGKKRIILEKCVWSDNNLDNLNGTPLEKLKDSFKKGRTIGETFREILEKDKGLKGFIDKILQNTYESHRDIEIEGKMDILDLFSRVVDKYFSQECINVFVFGDFEDKAGEERETGIATLGGRAIFLDEEVVMENKYITLAHEVGHNLNLGHSRDENNVMHATCGGLKLDQEQCNKVNEYIKSNRNLCGTKFVKNFFDNLLRIKSSLEKLLNDKYGDEKSRKKKMEDWEKELGKLKKEIKKIEEQTKKIESKKALKKLEEKVKRIRQLEDEIKSLKDLEENLRKTEEDIKEHAPILKSLPHDK